MVNCAVDDRIGGNSDTGEVGRGSGAKSVVVPLFEQDLDGAADLTLIKRERFAP